MGKNHSRDNKQLVKLKENLENSRVFLFFQSLANTDPGT
jgi:hypothetical protein